MSKTNDTQPSRWTRLDGAAFGIVYGAISVLSILLALGDAHQATLKTAAILFGSVLSITLAKAFAAVMAQALEHGRRIDRHSWQTAWHHSAPTLAAANLPTACFVAAGLGWISTSAAVLASEFVCIALLALVGARAGWVLDARMLPSVLGALFTGGIGLALSLLKHLIH
jgi:hypothetical protein